MYKRSGRLLVLLAVLLALVGGANAQMAEDITQGCLINGGKGSSLKDESYRTVWESGRREGKHTLVVEAPEGKRIGGILIRWRDCPMALNVETRTEQGEWEQSAGCEADFLAQFIPVDQAQSVRLTERETGGNLQLQISSMTVLTPGEIPPEVQVWQKPENKVELMLLAGHPDDEVLWFGGLLPFYAGEQGRNVLVVNTSYSRFDRRLELLDCLWTCGVKNYPVFLGYPDICTNQRSRVLERWGWENILSDVTELYRRYRPDVVMLHAADGESGHGAHVVISEAGREAALAAADREQFPQSAEQFGTWDVPKVYMHKYEENQIRFDWHVPLAHFEGRTAFEVADLAFQCHRSQLGGEWEMKIGGPNDNSLFGLWRSQVGEDSRKTDLFENIVCGEIR